MYPVPMGTTCGQSSPPAVPPGSCRRWIPRADSSRWRIGLAWLLVLIAIARASTIGISRLQKDAAHRSELRLLLTEMQGAAWQQSTIRLEAVMANNLSPEAAQTRQQLHDYIDAIGDHFATRDPGSPQAQRVQDTFLTFDHAVDEEFILLAQGDIGAAQRLDAAQAAPAHEEMTAAIADADRHYQPRAPPTTCCATPTPPCMPPKPPARTGTSSPRPNADHTLRRSPCPRPGKPG
jgi:hypothetical protein